ncbi:MAG: hypothetical protein EXS13_10880 [Planctomycetes bacterium]|nr:hypothetical protein [Planctomycetota bacterium]
MARVRPELGALLELRHFEPGSESIESVSCRLHDWLRAHGFDKALFVVLCEVNAERMSAAIARELELGGWPIDRHDVLGELLFVLQRHYSATRESGPSGAIVELDAIGSGTHLFEALLAVARRLIERRVKLMVAESAPETSATALRRPHHCHRLRADDLRQWIAHVMVATLSADDRRLIQLRARRDRTLQEIATQLDCTPLEAGRRLRHATESLFTEVDLVLERLDREATDAHAVVAEAGNG